MNFYEGVEFYSLLVRILLGKSMSIKLIQTQLKDGTIFAQEKVTLDVSGHKCPIPVLRLRRLLEKIAIGEDITLLATDPMTLIDVPNFCREAGHSVESVVETDENILYVIKKC